jgi:hydroxypyruvate isomerase
MKRREFLTTMAAATAGGVLLAADDKKLPGKTKHTKFAPNLEMWWPKEKDFLKKLEASAALGYSAVEFWPWQNKNIPAVAETCERLKLEVTQFTAWGFTPGLNEVNNHPRFLEDVEKGCETAKKLKCKMMCVVGGNDVRGMTQEQMHENIIIGLKKAAPIAEKHGVTLILEAMNIKVDHKGHCLYGHAAPLKIVKAVDSKYVKLLWDLYHMYVQEGGPIENMKKGFEADAIAYLQIADHPGRNDPGTGEIDYPAVLKALHGCGYRGHVGLEFRPKNGEEAAAWAVHKADEW